MSKATANHQALYDDLTLLLKKHAGKLGAKDVLAVAANLVGKLIALQDQRVVSPAEAIAIVERNIQIGNDEVINNLMHSEGRS